jgi:hypothetical protein
VQGDGAPVKVHPHFIRREGSQKVNHSQRIPYLCKTARDSPDQYNALMEALADICNVVNDLLTLHMPEQHSELAIFCDILPLNCRPATYPFSGCVINIQVSTAGHRDSLDKTICVVIPFGKFEGGEVVLYEAGIVIDLRPGIVLIFPSFKFTHFNLHFNGFRGSVVLLSDKEGDSWVKDRNGWKDHITL